MTDQNNVSEIAKYYVQMSTHNAKTHHTTRWTFSVEVWHLCVVLQVFGVRCVTDISRGVVTYLWKCEVLRIFWRSVFVVGVVFVIFVRSFTCIRRSFRTFGRSIVGLCLCNDNGTNFKTLRQIPIKTTPKCQNANYSEHMCPNYLGVVFGNLA